MATTLYQPPKEFMRVIGGSVVLHAVVIIIGLILLNHTPKRDFLAPVYSVSLIAPEKKIQKKPVAIKAAPIKPKTVKPKVVKAEAAKSVKVSNKAAVKKEQESKTEEKRIESAVENIKKNIRQRDDQALVASKITELGAQKKAEEIEIQKRLEAIRSGLIFRAEQEKEVPEVATPLSETASTSTEELGMEGNFYLALLKDQVQSEWSYPEVMRTRDLSVIVSIKIDRTGHLVKLKVEKSSGNPSFDNSLLRAVKKAAPFTPLPEGIKGSYLETGLRFCPTCKE